MNPVMALDKIRLCESLFWLKTKLLSWALYEFYSYLEYKDSISKLLV